MSGQEQRSSGGGCVRLRTRLWRLCEAKSERLEFRDLLLAQLGEPLGHVLDRLGEPLFNVFCVGAHNATPHDVLEQLVAGLLEWRRLHGSCISSCPCISLRLGHEIGFE